ncbi:SHOCT domain-containing protein [Halobellus sp. Atlit-31R]|nr:SHOCT domain-containing protein [Halobellus sp. Atlit-31R]
MDDRRSGQPNRRVDAADSDDPVVAATALVVLGAGLGSLFGVPILAAVDFWLFFVVGYAVVVPLVSLVRGRQRDGDDRPVERTRGAERSDEESHATGRGESETPVDDALDRLRDRYARGELSDEQFERKLEALLETDTPENARERVERSRRERGTEVRRNEPEGERGP